MTRRIEFVAPTARLLVTLTMPTPSRSGIELTTIIEADRVKNNPLPLEAFERLVDTALAEAISAALDLLQE
jgi:hypothetical protein